MNITRANKPQNTTFGAVKVSTKTAENLIKGTILETSTAHAYVEDIVKQAQSESLLNQTCCTLYGNALQLQKKLPKDEVIILSTDEITKIENQINTDKKITMLHSFIENAKLATTSQLERIQKTVAPLKEAIDLTQKKLAAKVDSFLNEVSHNH